MKTDVAAVYMAGFFDGEGSIGLVRRKRSEGWTEYSVRISIGQNDGGTMDWIKDNFGGLLYIVRRDNSYTWIATNKVAYTILKRIAPYLKYKLPQAKIALRFFEEREEGRLMTIKEKARREEIFLALKEAKKVFQKSSYC